MTVLSAADLNVLRNAHPHKIRPYLSILVPEVVFCGQVIGGPSFGQRALTTIAISGDINDVLAGMTMFVGTSCGDKSKSTRRVRSVAGAVITVDENTVDWDDGDYVTVYEHWGLWGIFQYINPSGYTFYKDRDLTYASQGNPNSEPSPVAIMGWHRAAFLDGPTVTFSLDGSDSYAIALGETITTYLWACDHGTIANPNIATTTITFDTPGSYWVKLTVTDSNGKTQSTRRVLFVHTRTGADAPYVDFSFGASPYGDYEAGGWSASVDIHGVGDRDVIPDEALVVIWAEQFFNGNEYYIVNNSTLMCGYIGTDTINKNLGVGEVSFEIYTIERLLSNTLMRSVSLEYKNNPTKWYQYKYLTATRAVHHLLRWHSTLLDITDVILPQDDTEYLKACDDFADGSLYSMVDTFMREHGIFAHACCDKFGRFHVDRDIQFYSITDRAARPVTLSLEDTDRRGQDELEVLRNSYIKLAYCIVSGTHYTGSGSVTPIISQAPGELPHPRGDNETTMERCVIPSQAYDNMIAGRVMAIENREIGEIRVPLAGNYLAPIDIVPQEWIYISAISNKRDIVITGRYVPRAIDTSIQTEGGTITVDLVLQPEAFGPDGIPGPYPPGVSAPAEPAAPSPPAWAASVASVIGQLFVIHGVPPIYNKYIPVISTDFDEADPAWSVYDSGLSTVWDAPASQDPGSFDIYNGVIYGIIDGDWYKKPSLTTDWDLLYPKSWVLIATGVDGQFVQNSIDPANTNNVIVKDNHNYFFYTTNGGTSLILGDTQFASGMPGSYTVDNFWYTGSGHILLVTRQVPGGVLTVKIWESTDNGANFSLLHTFTPDTWVVNSDTPARAIYNPDHIIFGRGKTGATYSVYYTLDGGTTLTVKALTFAFNGNGQFGSAQTEAILVESIGASDKRLRYTSDWTTFTDIGIVFTDVDYLSYTSASDAGWLIYMADGNVYHYRPSTGILSLKSNNLATLINATFTAVDSMPDMIVRASS